ncbi:MAG: hypothetical protein Q4Q07_09895 [Tissierellia bacterium]|nr:hypothetical protein [Tissierellia bacterium]
MKKLFVIFIISFLLFFTACHQEPMEKNGNGDLPRMVMVNGEIYVDADKAPSEEARCGVMDGFISSSVPRTEKPKKDDQSNFGKDYGYQLWSEDSIQVNIDEDWIIFEKES